MPPTTPPSPPPPDAQVVALTGMDSLLTFVDANITGATLLRSGFTRQAQIEKLAAIFRYGEDKDALKAEKRLNDIVRESLEDHGVIQTMRASSTNNGVTQEIAGRRIASDARLQEAILKGNNDAQIPVAEARVLLPEAHLPASGDTLRESSLPDAAD